MKKYLFLLIIAASAFTSCVKSLDGLPADTLKDIALGKDTLTMYTGETDHVVVTLTPESYNPASLKWISSDTTVISVTNDGTIAAKKIGSSKVTISNQNNTVSVSALVLVKAPISNDSLKVGLIAYYPFTNSGADSSGNKNDGRIFNITSVRDRFGKSNSAYHFNGTSSYIKVKDNQALRLNNTDFTLSSWVKLDSYDASFGSAIFMKRVAGLNNGWLFSIKGNEEGPSGRISYGSGGGNFSVDGSSIVGLGNWYMVSCVYSLANHQLSIYYNGVLDATVSDIPTPNALITADLYIGTDNPTLGTSGYFFHGAMDDIRIYNRALSDNEIRGLYHLSN